LKEKFPVLKKTDFKKPPNGTVAVVGFIGFTSIAVLIMFVVPRYYRDYYLKVQTEKRALIGATDREKLAQGLAPWKDPFDRESKKSPPASLFK
jgi:hypothetical protein